MCLVVVALAAHPRYALMVAANRDEFHGRAALPRNGGGERPPFAGILAGRDLVGGGTWMGVRRDGRWALVTNVRGRGRNDPEAPSRGALVPGVLNAAFAPAKALAALRPIAGNLQWIQPAGRRCRRHDVTTNRGAEVLTLAQGIHGLSNARLDTPWPKLARTKDAVAAWAARGGDDLSPVFATLADQTRAPDDALPATGVSRAEWGAPAVGALHRERRLWNAMLDGAGHHATRRCPFCRAFVRCAWTRDGRSRIRVRGSARAGLRTLPPTTFASWSDGEFRLQIFVAVHDESKARVEKASPASAS